jgi:hypothetical protein
MKWFKNLYKKFGQKFFGFNQAVDLPESKVFDDARKKILVDRIKNENKERDRLGQMYNARLNEYLNTYFNSFSQDKRENEFAFDTLNKTWKKYVAWENKSQTLLTLKADSFEKEVSIIVSKNPQFKQD